MQNISQCLHWLYGPFRVPCVASRSGWVHHSFRLVTLLEKLNAYAHSLAAACRTPLSGDVC
jgi:hypothetical protein